MAVKHRDTSLRTFSPKWPLLNMVDSSRVVARYDRLSDTLYVHFFRTERSGVSVPIDDQEIGDVYLLVDPVTNDVNGIQIDAFLTRIIGGTPLLLDWLEVARLDGITHEEIAQIRRQIPAAAWKRSLVAALFRDLEDRPAGGAA